MANDSGWIFLQVCRAHQAERQEAKAGGPRVALQGVRPKQHHAGRPDGPFGLCGARSFQNQTRRHHNVPHVPFPTSADGLQQQRQACAPILLFDFPTISQVSVTLL